jgi:hypothetical protein
LYARSTKHAAYRRRRRTLREIRGPLTSPQWTTMWETTKLRRNGTETEEKTQTEMEGGKVSAPHGLVRASPLLAVRIADSILAGGCTFCASSDAGELAGPQANRSVPHRSTSSYAMRGCRWLCHVARSSYNAPVLGFAFPAFFRRWLVTSQMLKIGTTSTLFATVSSGSCRRLLTAMKC